MSTSITRRDFVKLLSAAIGTVIAAAVGLPAIAYLLSPALRAQTDEDAWIPLGPLADYPVGAPKPFSFSRTTINGWERTVTSHGVFVVRKNEAEVRVFSNICTHLGCRVNWHPDLGHYISPCHDGHFDIVGNVVGGPPPRPLDEFITKVENDSLFIQLPPYKRVA